MRVPTHQDILAAAERIKGKILRTPFIFSDPLSRQVNIKVYLKLESLQPGGSFKFRGANNAVTMLAPEEREKGVVAGQGTIGLEIDEDAPSDLEAVLVPVGGGGLISGIALGLKYTRPQVEVIGVESYAAPTLTEALKAKKPVPIKPLPTCADSLSPRYTGDISFEVATDRIRQVILLTEEELIEGVRYCLEELHLVVEPAGAAGISALLAGKVKIKSGPVCVVVSGSNLDKKYFKEALGL